MVDDKKVKRIVEYFTKKREVEEQLATPRGRKGSAVARSTSKPIKESPQIDITKVDFELSESATISIYKKAHEHNINPDILFEVYRRGHTSWNGNPNTTPQQVGFARVNSYIMQGKSYYNEDRDLHENFQDGRNPQDKGDMARHGLKGKSLSQLKKVRSSDKATPRQKQLAHWFINMHKEEKQDPCWTGYRQLGTKKKNGKTVPNCVPEKNIKEDAPANNAGGGSVRGLGYVSGNPNGEDVDMSDYIAGNISDSDQVNNLLLKYVKKYHSGLHHKKHK